MVTHFFAYCFSLSFAVCRRLQFVKDTVCCFKVWLLYKITMSSNMFVLFVVYSGHFFSASSSPLLLRGAPNYSTDTVSEFHAEVHMCIYGGNCPSSGGVVRVGSCPGGEMSGGGDVRSPASIGHIEKFIFFVSYTTCTCNTSIVTNSGM